MDTEYVVELEPGVWVSPWGGDPGRTLVREHAMVFSSRRSAEAALNAAREYRAFSGAVIRPTAPEGAGREG